MSTAGTLCFSSGTSKSFFEIIEYDREKEFFSASMQTLLITQFKKIWRAHKNDDEQIEVSRGLRKVQFCKKDSKITEVQISHNIPDGRQRVIERVGRSDGRTDGRRDRHAYRRTNHAARPAYDTCNGRPQCQRTPLIESTLQWAIEVRF